ncbi:MAG TPA: NPCBM/NEW2 domain-containing protein [Actinopolymorphaceae bacterium]
MSRRTVVGAVILGLLAWAVPGTALGEEPADDVGLAPTPPMGWNSWNKFHCDIDEELIRETADAMVSSGMRDAGYEYVNIDDCWMAPTRDQNGRLRPDPERFPNGIKALADYVHDRGLKLGIYSSAGTATCQGLPASLGYEEIDARTFAEWEVDYLKYDNCNNQGIPAKERYAAMGKALAATGRPIVYSICEWGSDDPWLWGNEVGGDLWRTTGDISDTWGSVMTLLDQQVGLEPYSGPHGWNDPDMLEVGNGGMTDTEYRAHMSLWALLNAPLLAGNDLRSMSATTLEILTDPDVIAVNQDWGGQQGSKRRDDGDSEVWAKPMSDGGVAVVLPNRASKAATIAARPAELGLPKARHYAVHDLWADTVEGTTGVIRATVPSHGAAMFVVRPHEGADLPPAVTVELDAPTYVERGAPVAVRARITNDGRPAIDEIEVDLTAPDGWTVSPSNPQRIPAVPGGTSKTLTWELAPDGGGAPGPVEVRSEATWAYDGDGFDETASTRYVVADPLPAGEHFVSDLTWADASNGWGPVERDRSNGEMEAGDGNPITIAGTRYEKGLGVHAPSVVTFYPAERCTRFASLVGVDDEEGGEGSVTFEIWGDGERLAASAVKRGGEAATPLEAELAGVDVLELRVTDAGDGIDFDHGDWAEATVVCG